MIQPLKDFGSPIIDGISPKPYTVIQSMFDAGQQPRNHYYWKSEYVSELSNEAIATTINYAQNIMSLMTGILIFQLGGAISRVDEEAMAASHRDAAFVLNINSAWQDSEESDHHIQWTRDFWQTIRSQLKNRYDPTNLFRVNQNIQPTV